MGNRPDVIAVLGWVAFAAIVIAMLVAGFTLSPYCFM